MEVLIVLAHPEPQSFNSALADHARAALSDAGHSVTVSDLYAENFNPVAGRHDFESVHDPDRFHYQAEQQKAALEQSFSAELTREQQRLFAADLVVFQFPLWWGGPPAILKGWFERVLAYGFAYVDGRRYDTGLFKGRRAILSVTAGGTRERFGPGTPYGELDRVLWQPQHLTLEYMGYTVEEPFMSYGAPRVDDAVRQEYMAQLADRLTGLAALPVDWQPDESIRASLGQQSWAEQK